MKKVMMTIAGMLFISLAAVNAQTDTTQRTPTQPSSPTVEPGQQPDQQQQQQQRQYRAADRVTVPSDQVPASLRETLQSPQYKGWENVPLYQDKTTQEYYFQMPDQNGTTKKLYRFDRNGKAISGSSRPQGGQ